jgi:hypothetical protein
LTRLERILSQLEGHGELGTAKPFDREYLRAALLAAARQTTIAFWAALFSQITVFLITAWFVIGLSTNPSVLKSVLAAGGGGLALAGYGVVRFWREKVDTDLAIALIGSMTEPSARAALTVVLSNIRAQRTSFSRARGRPARAA